MEIVDNVIVKFHCPADTADSIRSFITKSEVISCRSGVAEVAVYFGIEEMQRLAVLAPYTFKIPSPIESEYSWPGMHTPFAHQRDTARFLTLYQRAFCFNEAGTGKTAAAVWAADYLMIQGTVKRVLVICPLSIMYSAWQGDLFKTAMHRTCAVAYGSTEKREKVIKGAYEFVVINYDGVGTVEKAIRAAAFDLIIVDEANAYKTPSTKRWKTLARILTPDTRLWMMTGTPAAQSPLDAFGLARMVNPSAVPKFATAWRDLVMYQVRKFRWEPRPAALALVHNALQPAIRYEKAECLDLPEVTYQTRDVALSPQAMKFYKELKNQMQFKTVGETVSTVTAAVALTRLLQLSGGAVYTDDGNVLEFDVSPRLSALDEVIQETLHKVLVFVPFRHTIDLICRHLTAHHISHAEITGDVTAAQRTTIFNTFQTTPSLKVLVIQPQAASHGVTLTEADTVVFWSPVLSVETYLQCIARIDRVGQRNSMTVIHLQGSEMERRMYTMLQNKVDIHQKLVDLYRDELEESDV